MKRLFWRKKGLWNKKPLYASNVSGAEIIIYWVQTKSEYYIAIKLFRAGLSDIHKGKQSLDATKALARKLFQETLLAHKEVIDSIYREYYCENNCKNDEDFL